MSDHIYDQNEIYAAVVPLLKKYRAEKAILFGSYARQDADAASDIDLIVVGGEDFDPTDVLCIAEELLVFPQRVIGIEEYRVEFSSEINHVYSAFELSAG